MMKNSDEMVKSLFERREQYITEQNTKRKKTIRITTSLAACFTILLIVAAVAFPTLFGDGNTTFPVVSGDNTTINNSESAVPAKKDNDTTTASTASQDTTHINNAEPTTTIWLSADEVLKSAENESQYMGVYVPTFVAYQGSIYGRFGEEYNENSQYARLETEVTFRGDYSFPAYQVKNISDSVAIIINGRLTIYQKSFEVNAVVDGTSYEVIYSMGLSTKYSSGEVVQENEEFTVYQAIDPQNGEVMESKYVINILPLLKRELPNFFDGDENYGDAWWVAVPQSNE